MNIETTLRDRLAGSAAALDLPEDPWPAFAGREKRHRRTRRARVGVVAAGLVVLALLQFGGVPMPGWAPGIAIAASNGALLDSPLRGSLAGDTAWLDGMRDAIQDMPEQRENWMVADRSKIKFLYAGDLGDVRLALAHVPLRWGFLTDPQLAWYEGPAGAEPRRMTQISNVAGTEQAATAAMAAADRPGYAIVVGPSGTTAAISDGFTYGADGRVHHRPPITGVPGSGVVEMVLPPAPQSPILTMTITKDGSRFQVGGVGMGWSGPSPDFAGYETLAADALGDRPFDRSAFGRWVQSEANASGMALGEFQLGVRWTGMINGQEAALFTLQRPGEGVLAFAAHGGQNGFREDLRLLLPADGADRRPIGWWLRAEGEDDATDRVILIGPRGAATIAVTVAGRAPVSVPLDAAGFGETRIPPGTAATMTAYAADGTAIGSSPVSPLVDESGSIVGDRPETRVVS
ncbi:hypothetical protein [Catenuloplanes japonicus]|uniref:hypothetical protein n=1 Tax=Catenuloplanes japonicus TaxID=33876 RepID=UPI0005269245|nr:hypothetical protein [Catenuloplanes japonicus]